MFILNLSLAMQKLQEYNQRVVGPSQAAAAAAIIAQAATAPMGNALLPAYPMLADAFFRAEVRPPNLPSLEELNVPRIAENINVNVIQQFNQDLNTMRNHLGNNDTRRILRILLLERYNGMRSDPDVTRLINRFYVPVRSELQRIRGILQGGENFTTTRAVVTRIENIAYRDQ